MNLIWDPLIKLINSVGLIKGVFVVFFFLANYVIYKQYLGRLEDRQKEIDRLAADNREYRERLLSMLDKQFDYKKLSEKEQ